MFLESQTAKTMHLSAKNASRAPEGCHPCNLSIRATWGPFSYRRRAVRHPHLISQAAGAADFQGRRGYPNVRIFMAAGVARKPALLQAARRLGPSSYKPSRRRPRPAASQPASQPVELPPEWPLGLREQKRVPD